MLDFLKETKRKDRGEFARIMALLERTADQGPLKNTEKCRFIREFRVFEFKTPGGVRIFGFWDTGRIIVCSHGFWKKKQKTPRAELERAADARRAYMGAKAKSLVRMEEGGI